MSARHRAGAVGLFLVFALFAAGAVHTVRSVGSVRNRAANDTLDTVLAVGSEWRTAKRSFTWGEMDAEVARRLRVKRQRPWEQ